MDTQALQAFVEVATCGSFSQAAEQLHLTQPAISKRIANLEQHLGCSLFDRIGRHTSLTESGRALLPRAQRILFSIADAQRALSNLQGTVAGPLVIGTSHHVGLHRLPPVLRQLNQQYPDITLDIRFVDSEQAYDLVQQGVLELGIVTLPPVAPEHLTTLAVWHDPLVILVSHDHPLTGHQRPGLTDLARYPAVLPSPSTFTRRIVEALFHSHQLGFEVAISTNYLETLKMMVSIGLGWSVLPRTMLDDSVACIPIANVDIARELGVVYHPKHSLSNAARALLTLLEHAAQSAPCQ